MKHSLFLIKDGETVSISKDYGMWHFCKDEGEPCVTMDGTYTLEEAIDEFVEEHL